MTAEFVKKQISKIVAPLGDAVHAGPVEISATVAAGSDAAKRVAEGVDKWGGILRIAGWRVESTLSNGDRTVGVYIGRR